MRQKKSLSFRKSLLGVDKDSKIYENQMDVAVNRIFSYLSVHIGLLVISLGTAWTRLYYTDRPSLVNRVSFQIDDKPWMPPGFNAVRIIGTHYFGDLQLPLAWARYPNPWQEDLEWKANFLPFGKYMLLPFSYLPMKLVFGLYVISSLGILFLAVTRTLKHIDTTSMSRNWKIPFLLFCSIFVLTRPVLTDLDRGNFYTFCISLWVLSFIWLRENNYKKFLIAMTCLVTIKWFLLIPMIPFLIEKKFNLSIKLFIWLATVNSVSLLLVPGGAVNNLKLIFKTHANYTGEWAIPWLMEGSSVASAVSKIHEYLFGTNQTILFLSSNLQQLRIFCLVYLAAALYVSCNSNFPIWLRLYFALSTITFDTFETGWYAQMWISFVLLVWFYEKSTTGKDYRLIEWSMKCSAICMLIPFWISLPINQIVRFNAHLIIPPLFALLAGATLILRTLRQRA